MLTVYVQDTEPEKYSVKVKPSAINAFSNSPQTRLPAKAALNNNVAMGPPSAGLGFPPQMVFPYGAYPQPMQATPWYPMHGYPPAGAAPGPQWPPFYPPNATLPPPQPSTPLVIPSMDQWLEYCDKCPDRTGDNLASLHPFFGLEGFCRIDQLVDDSATVENLSEWLSISKGQALLIRRYAQEDKALVRMGNFTMGIGGQLERGD